MGLLFFLAARGPSVPIGWPGWEEGVYHVHGVADGPQVPSSSPHPPRRFKYLFLNMEEQIADFDGFQCHYRVFPT